MPMASPLARAALLGRGLRLEWYIVILIVIEIVLITYDLFWRA